jgi:hypothetical protein
MYLIRCHAEQNNNPYLIKLNCPFTMIDSQFVAVLLWGEQALLEMFRSLESKSMSPPAYHKARINEWIEQV